MNRTGQSRRLRSVRVHADTEPLRECTQNAERIRFGTRISRKIAWGHDFDFAGEAV